MSRRLRRGPFLGGFGRPQWPDEQRIGEHSVDVSRCVVAVDILPATVTQPCKRAEIITVASHEGGEIAVWMERQMLEDMVEGRESSSDLSG